MQNLFTMTGVSPTVALTVLLLVGACVGQIQYIQTAYEVLQTVYAGARDYFGDQKQMNIFGNLCTWTREAGIHKFQWKYDGKIVCPGIGEYSKSACKSRDCAFVEPFKSLLRDFAANNRVPRDQFIAQVNADSRLRPNEKQELLNMIS